MSFFHENMLIGSSGQGGAAGYQIERSLRFNSADASFLSRTPASAGNRRTWTWAGWVKRSALGVRQTVFDGGGTSSGVVFEFSAADKLELYTWGGFSPGINVACTPVFRDIAAWFHLLVAFDTTQAVAANRYKLYVNGQQIISFDVTGYPTQNIDYLLNSAATHSIGRRSSSEFYFNGYLADVHFIDGQALTPTSFGEFDTNNVWQPKAYTGTYGTNGFQLKFADNSNNTATTLGKDTSGNSNNWTPNNLSVTAGAGNDSLVDSPTNYGTDTGVGGSVRGNYCTWNPLASNVNATAVNGNLQYLAGASTDWQSMMSTIGVNSGKWYCEVTANVDGTNGNAWFIGVAKSEYAVRTANYFPGITADSWAYYGNNGNKYNNNVASSYGATYTTNDIIGIAIDLDSGKVYFSKNGTWQASGNPAAGTNAAYTNLTGTVHIAVAAKSTGSATLNAGQRPFAYTAPSGFKALCTQNLPTPTITNGATAMDVKLYTGTDSSQTITGLGFSPDLVWGKTRNGSLSHVWMDTVRGTGVYLRSNLTSADAVNTDVITSFNSNGFTLGSSSALNSSAYNYAAWCWDAGSSTVTNTSGTISSQVRASASAGFSVVTYTGTGANATIGHGLGVAPRMVIVKRRDTTGDWAVWHTSIPAANYLLLNSTAASTAGATYWNSTSPTSTVFSVGTATNTNANTGTYVAYCWAPVAGYSAFGSYTGNGSADGPMVFTNMRPRWIMLKQTDTTSNWTIIDTAREGYNVDNDPLYPNLADAEGTTDLVDILSNGFKLRSTDVSVNASAGTYIYACFAENPFALARAR